MSCPDCGGKGFILSHEKALGKSPECERTQDLLLDVWGQFGHVAEVGGIPTRSDMGLSALERLRDHLRQRGLIDECGWMKGEEHYKPPPKEKERSV